MDKKSLNYLYMLLIMLVASGLLVLLSPNANFADFNILANVKVSENSIISQEVHGLLSEPKEVVKVYDAGALIGVVQDYTIIEQMLKEIYVEQYQEDFPDTVMGLGEDIYISSELSSMEYENKDIEIRDYLRDNDSFSIETNRIEFHDGQGVYATIYVRDIEDFYAARDRYLHNFISEETLELIGANQNIPELITYGSREMSVEIKEDMIISKGLASPSKIMSSMEEVLMYLSYGEDATPEIYVVQPYDTIQSVGTNNEGFLTAEQIVAINPEVLNDVNQVLEVGQELNIRYFESPITVEVTKELITKEIVYPGPTTYLEDSSVREGMSYVSVYEENGSRNVRYEEQWINGILVGAEEISSIVTQPAVDRVEYYGTKYIAGVGTGSFRWPANNARISCGWYCYSGHAAIDIVDSYNRYGNVYAADRGEVVSNTYNSIGGYYMIIDHNNGYETYYGHMSSPGYMPVGTNVEKGEVIGKIGTTGNVTGPHIHFYVEYYGKRLNPTYLLP